jgi:hypothetical protein
MNTLITTGGIPVNEQYMLTGASYNIEQPKYVDINDVTRTTNQELLEEVEWILSSLDDYYNV